MCGILGVLGLKKCQKVLLESLKMIQNRGYDSAGICTINNNTFNIIKYASDVKTAIEKIEENISYDNSNIGIAHTRWATNGEKSDINSHPHVCSFNNISVVHNGTIENYISLKEFLINNGYTFKSETDTEVISNLISYYYDLTNDMNIAIIKSCENMKGTFALCILNRHEKNKIYCIRRGCPLLISSNKDFVYIASEIGGFNSLCSDYFCLNDDNLFSIKLENKQIYLSSSLNEYEYLTTKDFEKYVLIKKIYLETKNNLYPYTYWLDKEINEQKKIVKATTYNRIENFDVKLDELDKFKDYLVDIENIIILGCGTSFNAGLIGMSLFKDICYFNVISVYDGAEFYEKDIPKIGKTIMILLSQSGETRDLHRCLDIAKKYSIFTIGIINVVDSLIAREVNTCLYLNIGKEISVASTKSFSGQIIILSLIALWFSKNNDAKKEYIECLNKLDEQISNIIDNSTEFTSDISKFLLNKNSLFILGKEKMEYISKESSLKIKEVGYIHAEGYSSSALKHGSYALLNENFPVILLIPNDEHIEKNKIIIEELKSRKAYVIVITDSNEIKSKQDVSFKVPQNKKYNCILFNIPIQLISFKLALLKNHNPDFPRNLAKVVTVD